MERPRIELIAVSQTREVGRFVLSAGTYTLGRSSECDLAFAGEGVSRQHARLIIEPSGEMSLEDLGSANGTWIEGVQIQGMASVSISQEVRLGATGLLLHSGLTLAEVEGTSGAGIDLPPEFYRRDRYDVGPEIAKGGMGAVLEAREATTRRTVAMKVILGPAEESAPHRLRFIEEAQITAQLEHPNIVPVHELGADGRGRVFYTMKMVQGITLKKIVELLQKGVPETMGKYSLSALLTIFQKVCDAIAFAHSKGVIHRDLKPANIMVGHFGEVLVMDWGLAKLAAGAAVEPAAAVLAGVQSARADQGDAFATMEGAVMGTPQYMSPEQARGEIAALDARSDIFSLGIILYQLLTLRLPFKGEGTRGIMKSIAEGASVAPPLSFNKGATAKELPHCPGHAIPESLSAVCMKALAHAPEGRYQTVSQMQSDLLAYQNGFATTAERAGLGRQLRLFARRQRRVLGAGAVVLVASGLAFGGFQYQQRQARLRQHAGLAAAAAASAKEGKWDAAIGELTKAQTLIAQPATEQRLEQALLAGAKDDLDHTRWGAAAIKLQEILRRTPGQAEAETLMPFALGDGFVSIHAPFAGEVVERLTDTQLQFIGGRRGERPLGRLPLENLRLPQGPHQLEIRREGARWCSLPVEITRGGQEKVSIPVSEIPAGYEYVPGGPFIMGDEGAVQADGSIGKRTVKVPGFFIRSTLVDGAEYARFRASPDYDKLIQEALGTVGLTVSDIQGGAQTPADLQTFLEVSKNVQGLPVRGVCLYEAQALARWADARLPREEEWEKAARGIDGRIFSTGNLPPSQISRTATETFTRETSHVSPYGCFALNDSYWQWTSSLAEPGSSRYVVKGGPGRGMPTDLKPARRRLMDPKAKYYSAGVILCRDLPAPP